MKTITEDYVSFETAKLLKEKGFDWLCHAIYDTAVTGGKSKFSEYEVLSHFPCGMKNSDDKYSMVISAPTLQTAMKWLREVYGLHIESHIQAYKNYNGNIYNLDGELLLGFTGESPEQSCEAAIKYCLENLI